MILKNFGPYEGTQTIDFTDRSGVTIFWGNNGRGKTTLLNAFRYALFGVVQRRSGPLKNLSEMENIEAASEGEHGFSVALEMTNDSDRYRLVRELKLRDGVTNPGGEMDYEKSLFLSKNGSIMSQDAMKHELNLIMPEQVSRFFLFDAELLQEYEELLEENTADGDQIKNAIEKILGVPVLQNGVSDLDFCAEKYDKQVARAARANDKTRQLGSELESKTANIEQHKTNIETMETKLSTYLAEKTRIEGRLKETEALSGWISQKRQDENSMKKAESELADTMAGIRNYTKVAWKGMMLSTIRDLREKVQGEIKELESKKQKKSVATHFIMEMRKAVADRICPVCGQDISGDVLKHLEDEIKTQTSEYAGLTEEQSQHLYDLQAALSAMRGLTEDVVDVKQSIDMLENQAEKLQIDISKYKADIKEMNEHISRYGISEGEDGILALNKKYSEIEKNITDIRTGLAAEREKLQKDKNDKDGLTKALEKQSGSSMLMTAKKRYKVCHDLFAIFDESKAKYREQLKKNVEKDASDLFVHLTADPDYVALKINENYGLQIQHRSGRLVPGRSSGYEHIVALSLIGALHKNAPLRGPIIMDSPFGRMDKQNSANIVHELPKMAEQSMLLAYNGEIDPDVARNQLGTHLLHEYHLERITSMHTEIK
ncbi:MAG: AAA family ATPase [Eubacterium sp.]|nr:AAA family ATPase [Eubacterium sp.]